MSWQRDFVSWLWFQCLGIWILMLGYGLLFLTNVFVALLSFHWYPWNRDVVLTSEKRPLFLVDVVCRTRMRCWNNVWLLRLCDVFYWCRFNIVYTSSDVETTSNCDVVLTSDINVVSTLDLCFWRRDRISTYFQCWDDVVCLLGGTFDNLWVQVVQNLGYFWAFCCSTIEVYNVLDSTVSHMETTGKIVRFAMYPDLTLSRMASIRCFVWYLNYFWT